MQDKIDVSKDIKYDNNVYIMTENYVSYYNAEKRKITYFHCKFHPHF